jgi:hypothetical protein
LTLQLWVGYFKHLLLICELHSWIFKISAAVIDPSTMGRLFLAFIVNMGASLRLWGLFDDPKLLVYQNEARVSPF